jgi:hypothetical protein
MSHELTNFYWIGPVIVKTSRKHNLKKTSVLYNFSDWMVGLQFPAGARDFSLLDSTQISLGTHPASYVVGTGCSFPGGKVVRHEADHPPPSSAEVKNGGAVPPFPHKI